MNCDETSPQPSVKIRDVIHRYHVVNIFTTLRWQRKRSLGAREPKTNALMDHSQFVMKTVYIIGAQRTGKRTLVNALETSYAADADGLGGAKPLIIREVARTVLKEKKYSREDIANSPVRAFELQKHILEAQHTAETTGGTSNPASWWRCDRSGLDPVVYASLFVGPQAAAEMLVSQSWKELEVRMKDGVVILCEAGCHWLEDDGTRIMPNDGTQ